MNNLENEFKEYRENTIGYNYKFKTCYGIKQMHYFDWTASGRLYGPIEDKLKNEFGPFVGNTHSEASEVGVRMTESYEYAKRIIKTHVNASKEDMIILDNFGMTGVMSKFQRMFGLRIPEQCLENVSYKQDEKPIVFITHMEHHSNQISWLETICDVVIVPPNNEGIVDLENLEKELNKYKDRKCKIGSFTACSNVTGILTPYHAMAEIMHKNNGICLIDFSASAPYVEINMHPENHMQRLDGIFYSPHKFLGGPGGPGIAIIDSSLCKNKVPDRPGGGTVKWTNPWGEHRYLDDIEMREDGGTPGFLQTIRAALAINLKEKMGVDRIIQREEQLNDIILNGLSKIEGLHILAGDYKGSRVGPISFYIDNVHYNLIVKMLNDIYGIQIRGGCSCAGTYGYYLFNVDKEQSRIITDAINKGDCSVKPGWARVSVHPIMTDEEATMFVEAVSYIVNNIKELEKDYVYDSNKNEYVNINSSQLNDYLEEWFRL